MEAMIAISKRLWVNNEGKEKNSHAYNIRTYTHIHAHTHTCIHTYKDTRIHRKKYNRKTNSYQEKINVSARKTFDGQERPRKKYSCSRC